jgi:hypothetical protein
MKTRQQLNFEKALIVCCRMLLSDSSLKKCSNILDTLPNLSPRTLSKIRALQTEYQSLLIETNQPEFTESFEKSVLKELVKYKLNLLALPYIIKVRGDLTNCLLFRNCNFYEFYTSDSSRGNALIEKENRKLLVYVKGEIQHADINFVLLTHELLNIRSEFILNPSRLNSTHTYFKGVYRKTIKTRSAVAKTRTTLLLLQVDSFIEAASENLELEDLLEIIPR